MPDEHDRSLPWTLSQRRAILFIFSAVVFYLFVVALRNRQYIPDPIPTESPLAAQLQDKIDPNTADLATLATLPGLGEKRAQLIIAYREKVQQREPGAVAFRTMADLLKIRGIGVAMIANLRPYIILSETATTSPAATPVERPVN